MFSYIINSIFIMNLIIFRLLIKCSKSIFRNDDWQIITTCDLTTTIAKPNWINTPIPICCHQIWIAWIFINSRDSKYLRRTFHSCCIHCTIWCYSIHRIILAYTTLIIINSHKINLCRCCL